MSPIGAQLRLERQRPKQPQAKLVAAEAAAVTADAEAAAAADEASAASEATAALRASLP